MSEETIEEGIQNILQTMADFSAGDVGIEEWTILDRSTQNAPFVIIEISDDFVSRQDAPAQGETWQIPANLYTRFTDWATSKTEFRDTRQNIIDTFNTQGSTNRAAGVTDKMTDIQEIRGEGPIGYWYRKYEDDDEEPVSDPVFVHQVIIFETFEEAN